jgi:hypothetical protein
LGENKHLSQRTEQTSIHTIRSFILLHGKRRPETMGAVEIWGYFSGTPHRMASLLQRRAREMPSHVFHAWLDALEERIQFIGSLIDAGQFPITLNTPEEAGCAFCDYNGICRTNPELQPQRQAACTARDDVYLPHPLLESS